MDELETKSSAKAAPLPETWMLDKRVPLLLVFALLMQAATAIWWASAKERDVFFMEQRLTGVEALASRRASDQAQIAERLARIEERLNAVMPQLDRIEKLSSHRM